LHCVLDGVRGLCLPKCDDDGACSLPGHVCHATGECRPPEACANGIDDNGDILEDCEDPQCFDQAPCAGLCSGAAIAGATVAGDTTGGTNLTEPECLIGADGAERVYVYTQPVHGVAAVSFQSPSEHRMAVRGHCLDPSTDVACYGAGPGHWTEGGIGIPANEPVYFVVNALAGDEGPFTLTIDFSPGPPEDCEDHFDDDYDGAIDCNDPDCQGTAACAPGSIPVSGLCTAATDCASAVGNDPLCIEQYELGADTWLEASYCTEWCDIVAGDCGPGAVCHHFEPLSHGVCFSLCDEDGTCAGDFTCTPPGICLPAVPSDWTCDPAYFTDGYCDCGCGAFDLDCADATVASCEFCNVPGSCSAAACPGTIDPTDNAGCL
jgi:hypothetical protein